jgi:hypothetical protein
MSRKEKPVPKTETNPWDLFLAMPTICGVDYPLLTRVMQDFAGVLEVDGVLDQLPLHTDQRAYVALLGMAFVVWDEPAAELRRRAELVLTKAGRGPVTNQPAFSRALRRTADLFELEM